MPEVDILLAAYNGEEFIAEQIESILAQTFQDFRLMIRDDGSSDNTPAIIEDYAAKYPDKIQVVHDDAVCRSATSNFFQLLTYARADYVMFCDQDDYWLPYKLQITLDYMKEAERKNPDEPVLIFTGLHVVDAELRSMDRFMALGIPQSRYSFQKLLLANCASGCTEMFNRNLYEGIGVYSPDMKMHDYWLALYASACGVIYHVPMALILYRQHSNNLIGAGKITHGGGGQFLRRLYRLASTIFSLNLRHKLRVIKQNFYDTSKSFALFRERYSHQMKSTKLQEIDTFLKLWGDSRLSRITTFIKTGYPYTETLIDKVIVFIKMML